MTDEPADVSPSLAQQLTMLRAAAKDHEARLRAIEQSLTAAERIAVLLAEQKIAEAAAWEAHRAGTLGVLHDSEPGTVTDAEPNAPR